MVRSTTLQLVTKIQSQKESVNQIKLIEPSFTSRIGRFQLCQNGGGLLITEVKLSGARATLEFRPFSRKIPLVFMEVNTFSTHFHLLSHVPHARIANKPVTAMRDGFLSP